ncbi:telomere repeat binding factor-domain-containing protein [Rhexocercosporidium sp. MPI-PUGE-AT-0058]|nr:telomere repeat binding factor-domain-containing protein [Rhexocercosporidium sp. MPI-PUGE-AT-0058]
MASTMASSREEMDVPIKHEASDYPTSFPSSGTSPYLKRRRSEQSQDIGEKRQRLDYNAPYSSVTMESPSIADLAEQASKAVMKQYELDAQNQRQNQTQSQSHTQTYQPPPTSNMATFTPTPTEHERSVPAGSDFISDPYLYMRIFSLPILESLSTQILSTLAQGPYSETIRIVQDPDSELGQAYATLKSLFDQTKRIYSKDGFFLSADELNIKEPEHRATIRTTNLASFSAAVFASSVGFYELSSSFIDIVTPDGACLEKEPGELLVNLKTQMYLSMVTSEEQTDTKEDVLEEMFPYDFEEVLKQRHPDIPLSQDEHDFVKSINARREYLMNEPTDVDAIQALSERFGWEGFLTGVSSYLRKNYEPLLAPYMKRHALTAPASPRRTPAAENHQTTVNNFQSANGASSFDQDISMHAQLAADEVLKALGYNIQPQQNAVAQQPTQHPTPNGSLLPPDLRNTVPYPTQSAPTQVLYEKARRAASTKANTASARRPGTPSQRRPWTNEEENTLMAGLDQVKGPHWSQILALYGPNGSLNDVLRDRNQVQLKDKARNLKLFFLKSGIEVPYYLQCVTGELKTRAPSQAAKREAEQRARLASEDEQMRQEGISALSGMASNGAGISGDFSESASPAHSEDSQDNGGEEFQVVEPEETEEMQDTKEIVQEQTKPPTPAMLSDEDHLRQSLMAANAGNATAAQ